LLEHTHQVRPYANQFVLAVKPHCEASEATADNLAAQVQPRRQRAVLLPHGDLLNWALQWNRMAV
jgi:hypothetical protein